MHGHFAHAIILDQLVGNSYWLTRIQDVKNYCLSCPSCQRNASRGVSTTLQPIVKFSPMEMMGMSYIEPISPASSLTSAAYIIIAVDYFTQFS